MDDELFKEIVKEEINISGVLRKIGRATVGSNYNWVNRQIKRLNLDTSHWRKNHQSIPAIRIHKNEDLFIENSNIPRSTIKKRIIKDNILEYKCSECFLVKWRDKKLSLILDHINGKSNDHRIENLRFLCPNCNSLTETFAGRNKLGNFPTCCDCGTIVRHGSNRCINCNDNYKSKTYPRKFQIDDDLLIDFRVNKKMTFVEISKIYNVSDVTVRNRFNKLKPSNAPGVRPSC